MKFDQVKPGMTLFDIDTKSGFKVRVYYLVFKKDSQLAGLFEISEGEEEGEWFYYNRKIDSKSWENWSLDEINIIQRSQFFDTLFTEIKSLKHVQY